MKAQRLTETQNNIDKSYNLYPIFAKFTIDTEDRIPFPTSGVQLLSTWESALNQWTNIPYTRFYLYSEGTLKLTERFVITPQLNGGYNNSGTPRSEWFRIGGPWDFWGLVTGEREARNLAMAGFTARWDLISRLVADTYLEGRANVASLTYSDRLQWNEANRILGGGVGVALSTWLGPMRFVLAWAGPKIEKAPPCISVSLGSSFPNALGPMPIFK